MTQQPSFQIPENTQDETTGRFIVTFRKGSVKAGMSALKKKAGVGKLPSSGDYEESAFAVKELESEGGVFQALEVAVVDLEDDALGKVVASKADDGAILDVEPERMFYAIGLSNDYLKGFRDSADFLLRQTDEDEAGQADVSPSASFRDDAAATWGLKATGATTSRFTGRGVKVAVLDTGMDLKHPDFQGRAIRHESFILNQTAQDGHGHGTHCIGTACGSRDMNGRRYGVASDCTIFAGKVLSNSGSGSTSGIIAGIEWAIDNGCQVISMSLGNRVSSPSTAYEAVGRRALERGSLIVAAAGNHGPGSVGQPANSPSILSVAAVDSRLQSASFSSPSGTAAGANVDIAGPGVAVYSSVPMTRRYNTFNGTSMATPHVAGIAAQFAQQTASAAGGWHLWALLTAFAQRLPLSSGKIGSGLVKSPS